MTTASEIIPVLQQNGDKNNIRFYPHRQKESASKQTPVFLLMQDKKRCYAGPGPLNANANATMSKVDIVTVSKSSMQCYHCAGASQALLVGTTTATGIRTHASVFLQNRQDCPLHPTSSMPPCLHISIFTAVQSFLRRPSHPIARSRLPLARSRQGPSVTPVPFQPRFFFFHSLQGLYLLLPLNM